METFQNVEDSVEAEVPAAIEAPQKSAKPAKPQRMNEPRITRRMRTALEHFVNNGGSITEAAETAGISREHLSKSLRKPHVINEVMSMLRSQLVLQAPKAAHTLNKLLDAKSEYVRLKAAEAALDRAGFGKEEPGNIRLSAEGINICINLGGD